MSGQGTDAMLDAAHERLKNGAPDPNPKRTKNPEYAVFRQCDENADGNTLGAELPDPNTYLLITQQVKASSRREAIKAATSKLEEGLKSGVFLVVPAGQVQVISRKTRTETVDDWDS